MTRIERIINCHTDNTEITDNITSFSGGRILSLLFCPAEIKVGERGSSQMNILEGHQTNGVIIKILDGRSL